jgi:hypothetical protein
MRKELICVKVVCAMMAKLQSQKYRTCIDTCHECLEACEICAVKCLHDENVKSLANCVAICVTCSHACAAASQVMSGESDYSKKFVICVLRYAKLVLLSVENTRIWSIVEYAQNHVVNVQTNVVKWQRDDDTQFPPFLNIRFLTNTGRLVIYEIAY